MKIVCIRSVTTLLLLIAAGSLYGQSSDQMFPTPVRTPEIISSIKARAIGDPRITTYYYTFEGQQGDVFINVQSKNFIGDIDVYAVPSQQPLTKIVMYGDQPEAETGRVIYLRKPERLLLRIQGRSPGDDDASVRVKFAGSFAASRLDDANDPAVPKVESRDDSNIRVNSVGTILAVIPQAPPTPTPAADRLGATPEPHDASAAAVAAKDSEREEVSPEAAQAGSTRVVVTDPVLEKKNEDISKSNASRSRSRSMPTRARVDPPVERPDKRDANAARGNRQAEAEKVDPMAGINLVIYFKDGSRIDRPMPDVLRFSVERAVLTVISKNGTIGRYSMAEVSRVSIE